MTCFYKCVTLTSQNLKGTTMKNKLSSNIIYTILIATIFFLLASTHAYAHFPWITAHEGDDAKEVQEFELGWGHHFPDDGNLSPDRISSITLVTPGGDILDIPPKDEIVYTIDSLKPTGMYTITAIQKGGYYSQTTQGGKRGSKTDHSNAISCGFSNNTMKALFSKGDNNTGARHILGHPLEIVPLTDPAGLNPNEVFPVKVLFHGKPFTGMISATWEGFEESDDLALEKQVNKDGIVEIPIEKKGLWMIMVHTAEDYPDSDVCDHLKYTATLTFRIK